MMDDWRKFLYIGMFLFFVIPQIMLMEMNGTCINTEIIETEYSNLKFSPSYTGVKYYAIVDGNKAYMTEDIYYKLNDDCSNNSCTVMIKYMKSGLSRKNYSVYYIIDL